MELLAGRSGAGLRSVAAERVGVSTAAAEGLRYAMSNDPRTEAMTQDAVQPMRARLSTDLRAAMTARDQPTIDTLRCLLAVLDNAGAQDPKAFGSSTEVPRKSLTQGELQTLMNVEVTSRRTAIIEYERGGRHEDAARLSAELAGC